MLKFTVPGPPQGKARPRTVRRGNYTTTYTPENTVAYENEVRKAACDQDGNINTIPAGKPVGITIEAYYPIPKRTSKAKRALVLCGDIRPTGKPDADNIVKIICDALNPQPGFSGAWHDDAQVTDVHFCKWYAETPRVEVTINER